MRERVYVPERIKSPGTEEAVALLANALSRSGACDYDAAKERIYRLLGWMCARKGDECQ